MGDEEVEGLSLIDAETLRAGTGFDRLIDNIVLSSPLAQMPVVGYENHAGRTKLGMGMEPFGKVVSQVGHGNDDISGLMVCTIAIVSVRICTVRFSVRILKLRIILSRQLCNVD